MTRKVAIIAPHFPEYSLQYAAGMASCCEVIACIDAGQAADEYASREMPALPGGKIHALHFKTPLDLLKLIWIVARAKPDIVHLQEAVGPRRGFFNATLVLIMKRFAKIALTVHDPVPHPGRDGAAARRTAVFTKFVRKHADVIVVHGTYCANQYRARNEHRSQTILISTHGVILTPPAALVRAPGEFSLCFFGRMEKYKGLEVLCETAELLHAEGLSIPLTIAGRGPELDRLESRLRSIPGVRIFNGFVPPLQVIAFMQEADCVILPYTSATQSGVVPAAFANHRYVVASRTGGLADVISDQQNGLLVQPGNVQELAGAVRLLAANEALRDRMREGARKSAEYEFNWDRIARELFEQFFHVT